MKRVVAVVVVLGLGFMGGVALAGDGEARRRSPVATGNETSGAEAKAALRTASQVPKVTWTGACQTLRCINNRLKLLKNAVNRINRCTRTIGVSQFGEDPNGGTFGYVWRDDTVPDEFLTTGLDFDSGAPHVRMMIRVC